MSRHAPSSSRIPYPCGALWAANLDAVKESLPPACDLVINLTTKETPGSTDDSSRQECIVLHRLSFFFPSSVVRVSRGSRSTCELEVI